MLQNSRKNVIFVINTLFINLQMSREEQYNSEIIEDVLGRKECLDPSSLSLLTYGRPGDICMGFESGRLGNMAGGFHFELFGVNWYSSEHLYLCGEWSLNTGQCFEIQLYVRSIKSGSWAWRCSKSKYRNDIRPDFASFRLQWMQWCVWQKCRLNEGFAQLLMSVPDDVVIVELVSKNDLVWSTNVDEAGILHGGNAMGKILTICRRHLLNGTTPNIDIDLLNASNIYILGNRIQFEKQ